MSFDLWTLLKKKQKGNHDFVTKRERVVGRKCKQNNHKFDCFCGLYVHNNKFFIKDSIYIIIYQYSFFLRERSNYYFVVVVVYDDVSLSPHIPHSI